MRKTKIIGTLGPATSAEEMIRELEIEKLAEKYQKEHGC